MMKRKILRIVAFIQFAGLIILLGCDPVDPTPGNGNPNLEIKPTGTLEIEFRVPSSYLPPNRVFRADLSLALDAERLYQGHFHHVANVYNSKLVDQFKLEPGNYYFKAGIICVAGGDSCSAAGFPGGQFGMKWAIGTATVHKDETIKVVPQFTQ